MSRVIVDLKDIEQNEYRHNLELFLDEKFEGERDKLLKPKLFRINPDGSKSELNLDKHLKELRKDTSKKAIRELAGIEFGVEITVNEALENLFSLLSWLEENQYANNSTTYVEPLRNTKFVKAVQVDVALNTTSRPPSPGAVGF